MPVIIAVVPERRSTGRVARHTPYR